MRATASISVPQPCNESWAAMNPTSGGRHCAACRQPVVDFTQQSDAEILAYLARAAGGRTCGRFAAGQLERPLQRAAPAAPTRWRSWLAAALAVWGLRATSCIAAQAQVSVENRARYWGGPAPAPPAATSAAEETPVPAAAQAAEISPTTGFSATTSPVPARFEPWAAPAFALRGVVTDSATHERLPGVTVLIAGTRVGTSTDADGRFELQISPEMLASGVSIQWSSVGYVSQLRSVSAASTELAVDMALDAQQMGIVVVTGGVHGRQPWPWHPRRLYYWGKSWLTRPFRRS